MGLRAPDTRLGMLPCSPAAHPLHHRHPHPELPGDFLDALACRPGCLARSRPALTRSWMSARSNSTTATGTHSSRRRVWSTRSSAACSITASRSASTARPCASQRLQPRQTRPPAHRLRSALPHAEPARAPEPQPPATRPPRPRHPVSPDLASTTNAPDGSIPASRTGPVFVSGEGHDRISTTLRLPPVTRRST